MSQAPNSQTLLCATCLASSELQNRGAFGGHACPACGGAYFPYQAAFDLFTTRAGISIDEISLAMRTPGPQSIPCAGCKQPACEVQLRGTKVYLCNSCGGAWLPAGVLNVIIPPAGTARTFTPASLGLVASGRGVAVPRGPFPARVMTPGPSSVERTNPAAVPAGPTAPRTNPNAAAAAGFTPQRTNPNAAAAGFTTQRTNPGLVVPAPARVGVVKQIARILGMSLAVVAVAGAAGSAGYWGFLHVNPVERVPEATPADPDAWLNLTGNGYDQHEFGGRALPWWRARLTTLRSMNTAEGKALYALTVRRARALKLDVRETPEGPVQVYVTKELALSIHKRMSGP